MNKKGQSPYVIISILIILVLIFGGTTLNNILSKQAYLDNVKFDKDRIQMGENTRLFFDVVNNGDYSLNLKVSVNIINGTECFQSFQDKNLDVISPRSKSTSYIYIYSTNYNRDKCEQKIFPVEVILKDINGKEFDKKDITLGVV